MSADPVAGRRPRRGVGRWLLIALLAILAMLALFIGLAFPWGPISGLSVETARVVAAPRPGGVLQQGDTPLRIAVTFSVPSDLETVRADKGAGFINAVLSACEDGDIANRENVVQRGGYFREGRVNTLPPTGTGDSRRYRYRATFDDWLPISRGSNTEIVTAVDVGGGLCFSLGGGSMWMGKLWSDRIRLKLINSTGRAL